MSKKIRRLMRGTGGSVGVITGLGIVMLLGMASLVIDLGRLYTVRNELQNSTDAAALAAAGELIKDQGGVAVRDAYASQQAALTVAQRQSQLSGLPPKADAERTDVTITFGEWNLRAGNPDQAWTEIGSTCSSDSTANAVKVTISRASGLAYGPVTHLLAGILGINTSQVSATAIAYLGYTISAYTGAVNLPLALPDNVLVAANQGSASWWAKLFSPSAAIASAPKEITFKDLASDTFYQDNLSKPQFDTNKAYLVLVNQADSVPTTVINNIKNNYTSGTPIRPIDVGSQLYPMSEYAWASYNKQIFQALNNAYNAKKDSQGKWRVCVPVYKTTNPVAQSLKKGFLYLARLMYPGVTEAHACFKFWTQTYPGGNVPIYVNGFANVDITNVNYNPSCDDCSQYAPAKDGQNYPNTTSCMVNSAQSCRNTNSITIQVPVDASTLSPSGTISGGPSNQNINSGAPTNVGAFASIPRLVK